jgi:hypothetical protein
MDGDAPKCTVCDRTMLSRRTSKQYCSAKCRQKAYRRRTRGLTRQELQARFDKALAELGQELHFARVREELRRKHRAR